MAARIPKTPGYDIEDLRDKFPSLKYLAGPPSKTNERAWVAAFTHKPEALEGLLSDLIKQAYAVPGRIGQRPMPREQDVNLEALIHGEYTDQPLAKALPPLVVISERAFCSRIHMSRRTYQRMLLNVEDPVAYHPDMEIVRRIAEAVKKPASYFIEYRMMAAQAAFVQLITDRPGIATKLYKDWLVVQKKSPFVQGR